VVECRGAWVPLTKLRTPSDYEFAALRSVDTQVKQLPSPKDAMDTLGQCLWSAPSPSGWPDRAVAWNSGEAILQRFEWGYLVAGRVEKIEPAELASISLGPFLRSETSIAIRNTAGRRDGLALMMGGTEFQRR
jgi:uncharacterized protein (DUF1800 family)